MGNKRNVREEIRRLIRQLEEIGEQFSEREIRQAIRDLRQDDQGFIGAVLLLLIGFFTFEREDEDQS